MKSTAFSVSFLLALASSSQAATIVYDFTNDSVQASSVNDTKTSAATSNNFGAGVTASVLSLIPGSGGSSAITNTHGLAGNMHGYVSFREPTNPTVSFIVTVDSGHTLNLSGLSFTYGVYTNNTSQYTDATFALTSSLGGIASGGNGSVTLNAVNTFQGGTFNTTFNSPLSNLTNTSVTFTWTLDTVGNMSGSNADRGHILDNITLTGTVTPIIPEPSAALLGGLGMLALLRRRRA